MKKVIAIILVIAIISIFNLINYSFEPLAGEKTQLLNIVLVTIYSIIVLGISIYFHKRPKAKGYVTETENLLSPILSEAVVDGKIETEELILSSIVEFTLRNNIRTINEDTIELVNTNDLKPFEKSILDLIFKENNIIHISKLDDIFINSNEKIDEIKEKILEELYEKNIFNYLLTKINKLMGIISLFILINLPLIFKITYVWIPLASLDVSLFIYYYRRYIKKQTHEEIIMEEYMAYKYRLEYRRGSSVKRNAFMIYIIVVYLLMLIDVFNNLSLFLKNNIIYFISMLINICINLYIISKSNNAVFTTNGKSIQTNLQKLRNYIKDYNLINEEKIKSVVLWDKYVAYGIAFRIMKNTSKT